MMFNRNSLARFASSESGAITVDWLVVSAAMVALAIAVSINVRDGSTSMASNTAAVMDTLN